MYPGMAQSVSSMQWAPEWAKSEDLMGQSANCQYGASLYPHTHYVVEDVLRIVLSLFV